MPVLLVVDNPKLWPLRIPDTQVVSGREYLTNPRFIDESRTKVFNLCRTSGYQSVGYYVSLLAAARGHRPLPSVTTLQDLRQSSIVRIVSEDLEALVQRALAHVKADRFPISIYFGRNLARRYDRLCQALFNYFPSPLLRAEFVHVDQWRLHSLRPISSGDIPEAHRPFVVTQAKRFFERPRVAHRAPPRYEIAVLVNREEVDAPSDERALQRFVRAGRRLGLRLTMIEREDIGRIAEFDALFIRETTSVNHHTYRFASRAAAEGLVVIDDPTSIVRCSNKVYQAELFQKHHIPCPPTMIVHRDNVDAVASTLGLPVVLKRPDSSFSQGVVRADDATTLATYLERFFETSELVVAQGFVPSTFDWRVGVLDRRALFAARYHMARGHWQIQKSEGPKRRKHGKVESVALNAAPPGAIQVAVRAAGLVGDGLYGVDIKEVDGRFLVIEINDNPNIDAGCEDAVTGDRLYQAVMQVFLDRLDGQSQRADEQ
ncbi:MAG: RimK family protein [Acidobacteriota bacterium]|nr:RimK family protein [Acidobacteriota bacterium]